MPDEPKEQPQEPQKPDFSKPAPSMWDTFSKNRAEQPRDIRDEVKREFDYQETTTTSDLESVNKRLGKAFDRIFKQLRRAERGDVSVNLISENRKLQIIGIGCFGDEDEYRPEPHEDWNPDVIEIESKSPWGGVDENKLMHTKSYGGAFLPQYFRTDGGKLCYVSNEYIFKKEDNSWFKKEWLLEDIYEVGHVKGGLNPNDLQVISKEQLDKLYQANKEQEEKLPLDENDYEQLQTILIEIKKGEYERDLSLDNEDD